MIVTSPQELVSLIVQKALTMAEMMQVPVLGLVENFSYFVCPDCGKEHHIFGESHIDQTAKAFGISDTAKLPIDPQLASWCDQGLIELFEGDWLDALADTLTKTL